MALAPMTESMEGSFKETAASRAGSGLLIIGLGLLLITSSRCGTLAHA
jgi:hypothetical protein